MNPAKVWIEQCQAARKVEDRFRRENALEYLIGENFLNFLEVAETDAEFRDEIAAFVAEIKSIFESWQLAGYQERARQSEPIDPELYDEDDDPEEGRMYCRDDP